MATFSNNDFYKVADFENIDFSKCNQHLMNGCVLNIKNIFRENEIQNLLTEVATAIEIITKKKFSIKDLSFINNEELLMQIWNCLRDLPAFMSVISNIKITSLLKKLLLTNQIIIPYDWTLLRLDSHIQRFTEFYWHQDYHYNVITLDTITAWIPLQNSDANNNNGGISFFKNENNDLLKVKKLSKHSKLNPNRINYDYSDDLIKKFEANKFDLYEYDAGDCILFKSNVIHRSYNPENNFQRLVVNFRAASNESRELEQKKRFMARQKYPFYFYERHKEYIV